MNSYQSTIDSQPESTQRKCGKKLQKTNSLKRISKGAKVKKIKKFQNSCRKIQIQDCFPQTKNFNYQVRDYVQNIMAYVSKNESNSIITENYMKKQTDINIHMRQILVGWLIEVSTGLNLRLETLHLAVLLVDRYCDSKEIQKIQKRKYQVLGGACLYIAAKYEQIYTPRLKRYVQISDQAYTAGELLMMESEVLLALKFNIRQKSTLTFFDIKSEEYDIPKSVVGLGYFLQQMCLVQFEFCRRKPTYLSLAILYTAMKLKKKKIPSIKVFAYENLLEEDLLLAEVDYIYKFFSIRHLPKFSPIRKRYSALFTFDGELK